MNDVGIENWGLGLGWIHLGGKLRLVGLGTGAGALGGTGVMAESWPEHVWWPQVRLRTAGKIVEWQNIIYIM